MGIYLITTVIEANLKNSAYIGEKITKKLYADYKTKI